MFRQILSQICGLESERRRGGKPRTTTRRIRPPLEVEQCESRELLSAGIRHAALSQKADGSERSAATPAPALRANRDSNIILYSGNWSIQTDANCCSFFGGVTFTQNGTTVNGVFAGGTLTGKIIKGQTADGTKVQGLGFAGRATFPNTPFGPKTGTFSATLDPTTLTSFTGILKIKGGRGDHTFNGQAPANYFDETETELAVTLRAGGTRARADQLVAFVASIANLGPNPIPGNQDEIFAGISFPVGTNFIAFVQGTGLRDCSTGISAFGLGVSCRLEPMITGQPAVLIVAVDFSGIEVQNDPVQVMIRLLAGTFPGEFSEPTIELVLADVFITITPPRR